MQLTKTLTSALAAAGLVGAIGLAYAQATDPAQPAQTAPSTTQAPAPMPAESSTTPPASSDAAAPTPSTNGSTLPPQQDRN